MIDSTFERSRSGFAHSRYFRFAPNNGLIPNNAAGTRSNAFELDRSPPSCCGLAQGARNVLYLLKRPQTMARTVVGAMRPSPEEIRRVFFASIVGTIIEWYDFLLYGIAAALIVTVARRRGANRATRL